jgi:hypothetical protein
MARHSTSRKSFEKRDGTIMHSTVSPAVYSTYVYSKPLLPAYGAYTQPPLANTNKQLA